MLNKLGSQLRIMKTAASVEELVMDKPLEEKIPGTSHIIEPKNEQFLYLRARAISSYETNGANGNHDAFGWDDLLKSYASFQGKCLYVDHDADSVLKAVGRLIDSYPVEDPETGEKYIEVLAKIDKYLFPELSRQVETGVLSTVSMGCSVDDSTCSVCGTTLHSDADPRCEHLEPMGLGREFEATVDNPKYKISKGQKIKSMSLNSGIAFNELSLVGIPADPQAVVKTILSNMRNRLSKKASLSPEDQADFVKQFENLLSKVDSDMAIKLKAEFCGICPQPIKESSMSDTNLPNSEVKKVLDKISAYEMEQLESYVNMKTKKANEIINKEVVADATKKEETFLSKIVAKVKDSFAAQLLEKKIETVAKEELGKEAETKKERIERQLKEDARIPVPGKCKECGYSPCHCKESSLSAKFNEDTKNVEAVAKEELGKEAGSSRVFECDNCEGTGKVKDKNCWKCKGKGEEERAIPKGKESSLSAKFNEDTKNVLASTWEVFEGDKLVLDASLKDIWGSQFATLSFADQKWATSEAYGKEAIARYQKEGVEKLADLWDVSNKIKKTAGKCERCEDLLSEKDPSHEYDPDCAGSLCAKHEEEFLKRNPKKAAAEPKMGPSGTRAKPNTGTNNKEHNVKNSPVTKPGQETAQKGPAAPAGTGAKTDPQFKMPGQEKGQTGPAAPKPKEVKTDYSEPKPEAEGKEVKTTPKNPEEKKLEKSEKEVETDYVAVGTEAMEAEEKGKEDKSKKEASEIYCKDSDCKAKATVRLPEGNFCEKHAPAKKEEKKAALKKAPFAVFHNAEEARDYAIGWQNWVSKQNLSYGELADWEAYFEQLAERFPELRDEFAENAIIGKKASVNYKQANAQIKWSSMTPEAQDFIKKHVEKHIKEDGMERAQAVAAAYSEAREKGMDVPSKKSSQEPIMEKKAADKPVESVDGSTLPEGKKAYDSKPDEAVQGTTLPEEGKAATPETSVDGEKVEKTPNLTVAPVESVEETTIPNGSKVEESVQKSAAELCKPCGLEKGKCSKDCACGCMAEKKEAATEMPMPEDKPVIEEKPEVPAEHETENLALPVDGPKVDAPPVVEMSAFDAVDNVDIGEGYSAHKDKESKEIIVEKDGKEVKRLPDGFGKEMAQVLPLMKAVLGLPPEEAKPEVPAIGCPMEEHKEEVPTVEEHPALEEAHEDELGIKESALKAKEAELIAKEAELKAKEESARKVEASKKFAEVLKARSERCKKLIASMVEKSAIQMDQATYDEERQNGTYLLDAQHKAFEAALSNKHKELIAMSDDSLLAMEKVVADLKAPVVKKASHIFASPSFGIELSEDETLKKIFDTMGDSKRHPQ